MRTTWSETVSHLTATTSFHSILARFVHTAARLPAFFALTLLSVLVITPVDAAEPPSPEAVFARPIEGLPPEDMHRFFSGKRAFKQSWVPLGQPSVFRGLGPRFSESSCISCHINNCRSVPPSAGNPSFGIVFPIRSTEPNDVPEPNYGRQIDYNASPGYLPEAVPHIVWKNVKKVFLNSEAIQLRRPLPKLTKLISGPLHSDYYVTIRVAPSVAGIGVIADSTHPEGAAPFGWNGSIASIDDVIERALWLDSGLTSSNQPVHDDRVSAHDAPVEVSPEYVSRLRDYLYLLSPPARVSTNEFADTGSALFTTIGCAKCHSPTLSLRRESRFNKSSVRLDAYTDLCLHDLGDGLYEETRDGTLVPTKWRTAPLWGLGSLAAASGGLALLHDGRASSLEEAILWHGGEAAHSASAFVSLSVPERNALLAFLRTL